MLVLKDECSVVVLWNIITRYDLALADLSSRGQAVSLNYLQEIVRNKIGERCRSYGEQVIKVRKMFEYFDLDGN